MSSGVNDASIADAPLMATQPAFLPATWCVGCSRSWNFAPVDARTPAPSKGPWKIQLHGKSVTCMLIIVRVLSSPSWSNEARAAHPPPKPTFLSSGQIRKKLRCSRTCLTEYPQLRRARESEQNVACAVRLLSYMLARKPTPAHSPCI